MATYSFELDDVDDAAFQAYVKELNIGREAKDLEPFADAQAYVADTVQTLVAPIRKAYDETQLAPTFDALKASSLDVRKAIADSLGVKPPPPPVDPNVVPGMVITP